MQVWQFIHDKLTAGCTIQLLFVLQSEGSSPGRQGFKMAVSSDGEFCGTIGGGIMEQKLVGKAKHLLASNEIKIILQNQYHDKAHTKDQSGMICSGSQLNAFIPLTITDKAIVDEVLTNKQNQSIHFSSTGISIKAPPQQYFNFIDEINWEYAEPINQRSVIHIIGGGHVGLALSQIMSF
ncbi:MAG: XdhC family protein [Chitinophagaceae bacterium]|nr:XdhC family protein [Chitinophagaceae bacterium]